MYVQIDNDTALDLLIDRLQQWTDDTEIVKLYEQMYENYIESGAFDGGELNVSLIVDNDWVNYCTVIEAGDDCYKDIKQLYEMNGLGDISCEDNNGGYSFIEAEYNGLFLVRC